MILIIGLGNPGIKYEYTPHSIGFLVIDFLKKKNNFPDFRLDKKSKALISESSLSNKRIVLAKPQTFMNESGKAIAALAKKHKLKPENILVVHDDIDLPFGKLRIVKNRGPAGHKGVESIINPLGTKNFIRVRIGIRLAPEKKTKNLQNFVLKKFGKEEEKILQEIIGKAATAIESFLDEGIEKAMNRFN